MKKHFFIGIFILIFSCPLLFAQTSEEKKVLDEINFVRTDPAGYVTKVLEPLVDGGLGTYQKAVVECISLLKTMKPCHKLVWSNGLYKAAKAGVEDKPVDKKPDTRFDGRISKYASWESCGEMVVFGYDKASDVVLSLLLDMQSPNRDHRRIIFSHEFTHLSSSIGESEQYKNCCVLDFAKSCISYEDLPKSVYHADVSQQVVSEINLARTKPLEYITTRLNLVEAGDGELKKKISNLIQYLKKMNPLPELTHSEDLCISAENSVNDVGFRNGMVIQSPNWEKNIRNVRNWGAVSEALFYGESDPRVAVMNMLLDADSNNRSNLLSPNMNYAGANLGQSTVLCVDLATWHDSQNTPSEGLLSSDAPSKIVEEINWARTNPKEYVKARLEPLLRDETSSFQSDLRELIKDMNGMKSVAPLTVLKDLNDCAKDWTDVQGKKTSTEYDTNWQKRFSSYGIFNSACELTYFGKASPDLAVATMLVDHDLKNRDRRKKLLSADYRFIGTATEIHGVFSCMAVVDLVSDFIPNEESVLNSVMVDSKNNVTQGERDVLDEINFARTSPKEYVEKRLKNLVANEKTSFQSALSELIDQMNSMEDLPALIFSTDLHKCAEDFAQSAGKKGITTIEESWIERVVGDKDWKKAGEVVSLGKYSAKDIVIQLLVAPNVPNGANRKILFSKDFTNVGISIAPHSKNDVICVIDLRD